ncbi:hypothetical protein LTR78_000569 [Recurvomyces mirabilis]|uniref:Large ribosomal subunit protein mL67 n=1 Tax=Recurvomyces mirabilis TaxID=574656 RepID=A0AAE1C6R2_9PEZI|nr:hypothetical protein LTR78_000569 [Recurvomyces mirabilis]KAK5162223.1 hypothetical protein LTS14_000569 [Recurvomyces mirabilis]
MKKVRLASSTAPAEHGRYIYAYCNVRTKQVVYSLSHTLNSHASIKQLPDLGANNKPNAIRKDIWRPLYTLALPTTHPHALSQGLDAFQKLREYRKLHELNWTPPLSLSQNYSNADIEHEKQQLEDRGGSKKESVYDVIKRRKRKIRVGMVMNQKANSIADLAAVLIEQEEAGRKAEEKVQKWRLLEREKEVREMLALAEEVEAGKVQEMEARIAEIEKRLADVNDELAGTSRTKLKREAYQLGATRTRMVFAAQAVQDAREAMERDGRDIELIQPEQEDVVAVSAKTAVLPHLEGTPLLIARQLSEDAVRAEDGGLASCDAAILAAQASVAASIGGRSEGSRRAELRVQQLDRAQMELAYNATQSPGYTDDMVAQVPAIMAKLREMEFDLMAKDLEEVEERGENEGLIESLREMVAAREKQLEQEARGEPSTERQYRKKEVVEAPASEDNSASETAAAAASPQEESGKLTDALSSDTQGAEAEAEAEAIEAPIDWSSLLPSFTPRKPSTIPKRGHLRQKLKRLNTPIFSTEGVKVKWHNILDAEFAAAWPANVEHERMGWSKFVAPRGDSEAVDDVGVWREMQAERRKGLGRRGREVGENEIEGEGVGGAFGERVAGRARADREGFVEGLESRILQEVRELDRGREERRRREMEMGVEGERLADEQQQRVDV